MSWKFGEAPQCKPDEKTLRPTSDPMAMAPRFLRSSSIWPATGLQKAAISKHVKACAAMAWSQRTPSRWLMPGSSACGSFFRMTI